MLSDIIWTDGQIFEAEPACSIMIQKWSGRRRKCNGK